MADNQNENQNDTQNNEEKGKNTIVVIAVLSIILVALIIFAMITIDNSGSNKIAGNSTSSSSSVERTHKHDEEPIEQPTAANYAPVTVSGSSIIYDGKEVSAKEVAKAIAKLGDDYGAVITDDNSSMAVMTDLIQALTKEGLLFKYAE